MSAPDRAIPDAVLVPNPARFFGFRGPPVTMAACGDKPPRTVRVPHVIHGVVAELLYCRLGRVGGVVVYVLWGYA